MRSNARIVHVKPIFVLLGGSKRFAAGTFSGEAKWFRHLLRKRNRTMKRSMIFTLAAVVMSAWFIPSSVEAGPFQRLFSRLRGDRGVQYVQRDSGTDNGIYRRYSYEPSMEPSTGSRTYRSQEARKPNWWYPKADPRRYGSY